MFMNSDEIQKHAIVSDSPLSAGAVLVLLQEVFCGSTVAVWVLLPKAQIVKFGGFFFFIKRVERPFSANLMSMAITYMFADYGSNPILVNVFAHG